MPVPEKVLQVLNGFTGGFNGIFCHKIIYSILGFPWKAKHALAETKFFVVTWQQISFVSTANESWNGKGVWTIWILFDCFFCSLLRYVLNVLKKIRATKRKIVPDPKINNRKLQLNWMNKFDLTCWIVSMWCDKTSHTHTRWAMLCLKPCMQQARTAHAWPPRTRYDRLGLLELWNLLVTIPCQNGDKQ